MPRTLVLITLTLICISSPALSQVILDLSYQFPPGDWPYTLNGDYNSTVAGHNGSWMYFRTGGPPPATVYYDAPAGAWAAAVATGEFSVRAEVQLGTIKSYDTDPGLGLATIVAATGSYEFRLELRPEKIMLGGGTFTGTAEFPMDTTDGFHAYEIYVVGDRIRVWVDDALALDATNGSSSTDEYFRFGDVHDPNYGQSDWLSVGFGPAGAVPVEPTSLSGLKTRFGD